MAKLVNVSVNLSKIDKTQIVNGQKGKYLNLTVELKDEKDQYDNDVSCWQSQTKEEREAKKERNYLGNGRVLWSGTSQKTVAKAKEVIDEAFPPDDLPF